MQPTTQHSTNAQAGPSGTSNGIHHFQTSKPATTVNGDNDDDDLSSLPDEYKEEKNDSDEEAVVARSTWKGKERMIIHSDTDDDDDEEDVYQEQQAEKIKRERQREKEKSLHREQRHRQTHAAHQFHHEKLFGGGSHREGATKKKSHRRKCRKNSRRHRHLHDLEDDESPSDDDPSAVPHPGFIAAPDQTNDVPLPEGVDPKNVEDIFLGLAAVPVPAEWSDDEDEGMLFQALDEWRDSDNDMDAGSEASDSSNGTSDTDMLDEDDDAFDTAFGLGEAEMPFVLMEDWSGNLVFAQPRISGEGEGNRPSNSRSTSASNRGKEKRSRKGSGTGSTTNGEGPVLLVDEGALDDLDENVFDGDTYDGDTTDSLPDEDMPSPPSLTSFFTHVGGVEAQNAAAFGVTTVDEAALARDLGVPLADARNLLERARAEEQQQLLGGVSSLSMTANEEATTLDASPVDGLSAVEMSVNGSFQALFMDNPGVSTSSTVTTPNTNIEVSPHPAHAIPGLASTQSTPPTVTPGFPVMGSFLPEHDHPDRVAVIDGTGKVTPSPFMRRGGPRGRAHGSSQTGGKSGNVKRQAVGASPSMNGRRPRYSSVPAGRGHISDSVRGSPLRLAQRESFDAEDTSSDHEDMAEPIALDDVLDTSALHHHGHESDHTEEIYGSRHLRSLRRWEKVPITTFRRSRNSNTPFTSSTGLFAGGGSGPASGFPHPSGAILRPSFASPSIATTLAMDSSAVYPVSPVLEATNQDGRNSRNGRGNGKEKRSKTQDGRKTSRNGGLMRNRTSSAGSMPPLRLS